MCIVVLLDFLGDQKIYFDYYLMKQSCKYANADVMSKKDWGIVALWVLLITHLLSLFAYIYQRHSHKKLNANMYIYFDIVMTVPSLALCVIYMLD